MSAPPPIPPAARAVSSPVWNFIRTSIPKKLWSKDPVCPSCAYSLIGLPEYGRCPECGNAFTLETSHLSASRTLAQLRRALLFYGVVVLLIPIGLNVVARSTLFRNYQGIEIVIFVVLAPIASARVIGALIALLVEAWHPRSHALGLVMLLVVIVAHLVFMVLTLAAMALLATYFHRFLR